MPYDYLIGRSTRFSAQGFPALLAFFFYFTKNLEIGNKI